MPRRLKPHAVALIGIVLLGASLRFWQNKSLPPGYHTDEAHKSIVAFEIARGERAPVYVTDIMGLEAGYFWLLAGWYKLFGEDYYATRQLAGVIGTLTLVATAWSVRQFYRHRADADLLATFSTSILAFLFWHILYSRFGLETILVPFFSILLMGGLAAAWHRQTYMAFGLAGVLLGLSQYSNPGARVLPLMALVVFWGLARGSIWQMLRFGLVFTLGAIIVYAPLGLFYLNNPQWFLLRMQSVSEQTLGGSPAHVLSNAAKIAGAFNVRGDLLQRHNVVARPIFDAILSFWMLAGLAHMTLKRHRAHLILVLCIAINIIPSLFSDGAPHFGRMLGAAPLVVIVPALGLAPLFGGELGKWPRQTAALGALALLVSAALNIHAYFVLFPQQAGIFKAFETGLWQLTQQADEASRRGIGYLLLSEGEIRSETTQVVRQFARGDLRIINADHCTAYPREIDVPTVFAVQPHHAAFIDGLYPRMSADTIVGEVPENRYGVVLSVSPPQQAHTDVSQPIATFGSSIELARAVWWEEDDGSQLKIVVQLVWHTLQPTAKPYNAFVHLANSDSPFIIGADAEPCDGWYGTHQWHTGEIVEQTVTLVLPGDFAEGDYKVLVGLYDWHNGERLPVEQAEPVEPDRALAGEFSFGK